MMGVALARRLARFRQGERRILAAELALATGAATDAAARIEQIIGLSRTVSTGAGKISGAGLAARGEFVARLSAGQVVATVHRDRQAREADEARQRFGLADARAGFAERGLVAAESLNGAATERRATLKLLFRRTVT